MTNDKQRERLSNMLFEAECLYFDTEACKHIQKESFIADYLLANGVIVPTIKLNDIIYRCGEENVHEWQIVRLDVYPDEIVYIDDSDNEIFENDIGVSVFLSYEEAEKALGGVQG